MLDKDTGLVHFGYREYDPEIGRFTTPDPMGFAGGDVDIYGYCWDDPNNFVDRDGLKGESEDSDEKSSKKDRNVSKDQKEANDKQLIEGLEREYDDPKPSAIIWGGDKRSIFNGPKYGKWGGELHSGGVDGGKIGTAPPVDSSDEVYKEHDLAYDDIQHEDILSDVNKEQKRLIKKADKAFSRRP